MVNKTVISKYLLYIQYCFISQHSTVSDIQYLFPHLLSLYLCLTQNSVNPTKNDWTPSFCVIL